MNTYKSIDVWRRVNSETAIRFRCFQINENATYCVQSADMYHEPIDEKEIRFLERQFIELFIEEAPETRNGVYPTLEEAIAAHEKEFEEYAHE